MFNFPLLILLIVIGITFSADPRCRNEPNGVTNVLSAFILFKISCRIYYLCPKGIHISDALME